MNLAELDWNSPVRLPSRPGAPEQCHQFDDRSAMAIRAAIHASRPLLIRGLPGVGKTQLAFAAANILKRPIVHRTVDSRTESRDLLWTYDPVRRLADAQLEATLISIDSQPDASQYSSNDEQQSIRRENARGAIQERLSPLNYIHPGPLWWAFDWDGADKQARRSHGQCESCDPPAEISNGAVILIDEIDKADADVPNGLLEALGANQFRPFGFEKPVKSVGVSPLVVITTNEERSLPDAFVRRCLVLHLKLPSKPDELKALLVDRARIHFPNVDPKSKTFEHAAHMIVKDRETARQQNAHPLPGQAEFLDLLRAVLAMSESETEQTQLLEKLREFTLQKATVSEQ